MNGPETVSVLAGGWSVRAIAGELGRLPGVVIAANDAGLLAPRVDEIVSMDRLWTEHRWAQLKRLGRRTWLRQACLINIAERPDWLSVYACDWTTAEPSVEDGELNGPNSGTVAFNRALQLRPRRIVLFGFDMGRSPRGEAYWYPPYPWAPGGGTTRGKYAAWAASFEPLARACAAAGIEVLNASPVSAIPAFPKVAAEKVLTL